MATLDETFTLDDSDLESNNFQSSLFAPYSDANWLITELGLDRLTSDYYYYNDTSHSEISFTSNWSFLRDYPIGSEEATGYKNIYLKVSEF